MIYRITDGVHSYTFKGDHGEIYIDNTIVGVESRHPDPQEASNRQRVLGSKTIHGGWIVEVHMIMEKDRFKHEVMKASTGSPVKLINLNLNNIWVDRFVLEKWVGE